MESMVVVVPSWGTGRGSPDSYEVTVDRETRMMVCGCDGFRFRAQCHHLRYLVGFTTKPQSPRPAPVPGVADTSLAAYRDMTEEDLGINQQAVLDVLRRHGPLSNRQIAGLLQWSINRVTPRCLELRQGGMVEDAGYSVDPLSGKSVHLWRATA